MVSVNIFFVFSIGVYSCAGLQCYDCMGSPGASFAKNNPHCLGFDDEAAVEKLASPPGGKCSQILLDCERKGQHSITLAVRSTTLHSVCDPETRETLENTLEEALKAAGEEVDSAVIKDCSTCEDELCNDSPYTELLNSSTSY